MADIDSFREKLQTLITKFEKDKTHYLSKGYPEAQAFDREGFCSNDKTTIISTDDLYLLGILNSKVADFAMHSIASTKQGCYFEYKPMYLQQLPIAPSTSRIPLTKPFTTNSSLSLT